MKRKIIYLLAMMIFAFAACEKTEIADNKVDEQTVNDFLKVNKTYKEVKNITKDLRSFGFKKAKLSFKSDSTSNGDSIWYDVDTIYTDDDSTWLNNWESCANITETTLDDGTFVMVIDYGEEGCSEYGELIKGKITISWKDDNTSYTCTEVYENLSYDDVTLNGTTSYSSSWTDMMNGEFVWEGTEDLTITCEDETITLKGNFKEKMTDMSYVVLEGNYEFTSSKGYSFTYKVTNPLVYDYECEDACIPVEGTEEISYTENGETTDFVVDYGDGTCDNLYTVTSNGETVEYNFEDEWSDEGDNWNDTDSTNVSG